MSEAKTLIYFDPQPVQSHTCDCCCKPIAEAEFTLFDEPHQLPIARFCATCWAMILQVGVNMMIDVGAHIGFDNETGDLHILTPEQHEVGLQNMSMGNAKMRGAYATN